MRAVNLLPKEAQKAASQRPWGPILIGGLLAVAALFALYTMRSDASDAAAEKRVQLQLVEGKPIPKSPAVSQAQVDAATEEPGRISALDAALTTRVGWDVLLRDISQVVPQDVSLDRLDLEAPTLSSKSAAQAAVVQPGQTVNPTLKMEGTTNCQESVARLLARLQVLPELTNVQLGKATSAGTTDGVQSQPQVGGGCPAGGITFQIVANVKSPGATS